MSDLEKELSRLKEQLERARAAKNKAEGQLEAMERERQRLLAEFQELGVSPDQLEGEVGRLQQEIQRLLAEARKAIPAELVGGR